MAEKPTNDRAMSREETGNTATSQALPFAPHTAQSSKVIEALHADPKIGLSESEVRGRLEAHGPNRLKPPKRPSPLAIVMRQIGNAMTLVLSECQPIPLQGGLKEPARESCPPRLLSATQSTALTYQSQPWPSRSVPWTSSLVELLQLSSSSTSLSVHTPNGRRKR